MPPKQAVVAQKTHGRSKLHRVFSPQRLRDVSPGWAALGDELDS